MYVPFHIILCIFRHIENFDEHKDINKRTLIHHKFDLANESKPVVYFGFV